MAKRDMKKALGASLKAEEQAVKSRFEKAGTALRKKRPVPREQAAEPTQQQPDGAGKVSTGSLALPDGEDVLLSRIMRRCSNAGISASRSEVLRAGLLALDDMRATELERLFDTSSRIKTGRPERGILTMIVHRAYTVKFRHTLQIRHFQFTRKIVIRHSSS